MIVDRKKLNIVIKKLSDFFGKPYDTSSKTPEILDVLIATKLSQSTTDKSAYIAFNNLKKKFRSWESVADAKLSSIKSCIKICGLSNTKAKNIQGMLRKMKSKYGGLDLSFVKDLTDEKVYEEFLSYKGIGVKTTSCVLIFALGRDAFPVDTHVFRTLSRLGLVKAATPEKAFEQINSKIPIGKKYELHSNLIKFGRNICRARDPLCGICFLYNQCGFEKKDFFRQRTMNAIIGENHFIILENIQA